MKHVDVAIVGGGFSAATAVVNLLQLLEPDRTIGVVGPSRSFGRGIAYSTADDAHRLNVPVGRMSLYADKPDDLCDWLIENATAFDREDFIPRSLFGAYIQDRVGKQLLRTDNRARTLLQDAQAIDCEEFGDDRQILHLSNGERLAASASIFCIGGTPAGLPLAQDRVAPEARKHICLNVWADAWVKRVSPDDTIFMVGSGLTMIDQVMSLHGRGHRGRIEILSRHGLVPLPHSVPRSDPIAPAITPRSGPLSAMMQQLRRAARTLPDWRSAIDGIRPVTQEIWQQLDIDERRRFLRHANAWWNIHRHRLTPDMRARFDEMRESGCVTVHAGWLQEVFEKDGRARIAYRDRRHGTLRQVSADWIVNCTGMEKCSISRVPLLKKMSARGMITGDLLGLGLGVNGESQILREDGTTAVSSYALGPMVIGRFFEIFAVPDIRTQAKDVAGRVAAKFSAA